MSRPPSLLLSLFNFFGVAVLVALCVQCGKRGAPVLSSPPEGAAGRGATDEEDAGEPMDEREREAWAQADGGDPADLLRLVDLVGCSGLPARASVPGLRVLAAHAMRYCPDFSELPWLAGIASTGSDDLAMEALETVVELAARPRRAVDPEDADELHAGCAALLALARGADRPRPRRVMAVRALRMLAERGCVQRTEIPTELDAK